MRLQLPIAAPEASTKADHQGHLLVFRFTSPVNGTVIRLVNAYLPTVGGDTTTRQLMLDTLTHLGAQAQYENALLLVQGDLNAATRGRRTGYSATSRVHQADVQLASTLQTLSLTEVLPPEQ